MCVHTYTCKCDCPWWSEEGVGAPGAAVKRGFRPLNMDLENELPIL